VSNLPWIEMALTWALPWALSAFFVLGFVINSFAVKLVGPDYRRWGYPDWFHFVTGGMELAVALLLPTPATRPFGIALGCGIMLAAAATVIFHREYRRAGPPILVFVLLALVGWTMW
jgi:DoxX-like family